MTLKCDSLELKDVKDIPHTLFSQSRQSSPGNRIPLQIHIKYILKPVSNNNNCVLAFILITLSKRITRI